MSAGISVVVPVQRVMEIIDSLESKRVELLKKHDLQNGFVTTSAGPREVAAFAPKMEVLAEPETDNPSHKEDFTRLLSAAVKAKPPTA
jgi:hypothetical protein